MKYKYSYEKIIEHKKAYLKKILKKLKILKKNLIYKIN